MLGERFGDLGAQPRVICTNSGNQLRSDGLTSIFFVSTSSYLIEDHVQSGCKDKIKHSNFVQRLLIRTDYLMKYIDTRMGSF